MGDQKLPGIRGRFCRHIWAASSQNTLSIPTGSVSTACYYIHTGPFWITTTLIFVMGMTGNLATYLSSEDDKWVYDFTKVTFATSLLYNYVTLV